MNYHYQDGEKREVGPVTEADLQAFCAAGLIDSRTLIRAEGATEWIAYAEKFGATRVSGAQKGVSRDRRLLTAVLGMAVLIGGFYGGSVLADGMRNSKPSEAFGRQAVAAIPGFPTDCTITEIAVVDDGRTARLGLRQDAERYRPTQASRLLPEQGEEAQAYAEALALLSGKADVLFPAEPVLYVLTAKVGEVRSREVDLRASKAPRIWSFRDCLNAWTGNRPWLGDAREKATSPLTVPDTVAASALPAGAVILGSPVADAMMNQYKAARNEFVTAARKAASTARWDELERGVSDELRQRLAKSFPQLDLVSVHLDRAESSRSPEIPLEFTGTMELAARMNLYRKAKTQPKQWEEYEEYERAIQSARNNGLSLEPPIHPDLVAYELYMKRGYRLNVRLSGVRQPSNQGFVVSGSPEELVLADVITAEAAGVNAIFDVPDGSPRLAIEAVRQSMGSFSDEVRAGVERKDMDAQGVAARYAGTWEGRMVNTANDQGRSGDSAGTFTLTVDPKLSAATYYYQEGKVKIECTVTRENDGLTIKAVNGPQVRLEMKEAGAGVAKIKSRIDRRNGQWAEAEGVFRRVVRVRNDTLSQFQGPPFRGGSSMNYSISVRNHTPSLIQVYVDDEPQPRSAGDNGGGFTLTLAGGVHVLTIVGEYGRSSNRQQKVLRHTLRVGRPGTVHVTYSGDPYAGTISLAVEERMK